jgi:8-oxo-dGTP pyrophosphatase MutT (NUDIX family)
VDDDGRIFFQRRSPTRKLFRNSWDIVGGHLEPGESVGRIAVEGFAVLHTPGM